MKRRSGTAQAAQHRHAGPMKHRLQARGGVRNEEAELLDEWYEDRDATVAGRRVDVKAILADPYKRRELMVTTIIATQAREGIVTTRAQAEAAYDKVQREKGSR